VADFGGHVVDSEVSAVTLTEGGLSVQLTDGGSEVADYLVLSEGRNPVLARSLGLAERDGAIATDREGRSSNDRVYVVGRSARPERSQAIISAGAGAVAAVDIIGRERGTDYQDWDKPA
jgi:pyruvate/2-oxoglutarate dehydrogenase complex dihydrolipoamide dehydrogenase (E3) component